MKAIALVVVQGGVAEEYAPEHVDVRIVDQDNIGAGDPPTELPRHVGFEALVERAELVEGEDYTWEEPGDASEPGHPNNPRSIY